MKLIGRMVVIGVVSLLIALGANAFRPDGIPVIRPSKAELALKEGITPIHLDSAKALLKKNQVLFLDARPPRTFKRGHIPGASNYPEEEFADRIKSFKDSVPLDRPVVTYCDGIECRASEMLAKELKESGYRYIYLFFGGWIEWRDAKLPIQKDTLL